LLHDFLDFCGAIFIGLNDIDFGGVGDRGNSLINDGLDLGLLKAGGLGATLEVGFAFLTGELFYDTFFEIF
jgi:hypothetical protein